VVGLVPIRMRTLVCRRQLPCHKRPLSLRVFGCLPDTGARGCTEAGVRKASREETAGEFATAVESIYGDLAPVLDLICRLQTATRVE
jgi:hypothetical protein